MSTTNVVAAYRDSLVRSAEESMDALRWVSHLREVFHKAATEQHIDQTRLMDLIASAESARSALNDVISRLEQARDLQLELPQENETA